MSGTDDISELGLAEPSEDPVDDPSSLPGHVQVHIRIVSRVVGEEVEVIRLPAVAISDTVLHLKSSLLEILETSCITSYRFILSQLLDSRGASLPIHRDNMLYDHAEIASFISSPSVVCCVLELVLDNYDLKKVHTHLRRCMEVLLNPPLLTVKALSSLTLGGKKVRKDDAKVELLPAAAVHSQPVSLDVFYDEVLHRFASDDNSQRNVGKKLLTDHVKGFFASGWNPPPSSRKLQGDLLYVEVILVPEGSLHLTCTALGFFMNRSSRTHFDPSPAPNHHFHHELMDTLRSCCASFCSSWQDIIALADESKDPPGSESNPLDAIASAYSTGRPPSSTTSHQWIVPRSVYSAVHSYDLFRSQLELCDLHGMEEPGASREWFVIDHYHIRPRQTNRSPLSLSDLNFS